MSTARSLALCERYFDGWQRHDADAIVASLGATGHYSDPLTAAPIRGDALRDYAAALWRAFPDLAFALELLCPLDERRVLARWTMRGRNEGSYAGLPPTGRAVELPGVDLIETGDDALASVTGYFDSAAVPRQLGLETVVQPARIGPFAFGTSSMVRRERPALPGVVGVTELLARDAAAVARVRELSRQVVVEQLDNPDFLGFTGSIAGRRMTTCSAWTTGEALSAAMRAGTHAEAMRELFDGGLAEAALTGVYAPQRVGPAWRRCEACTAMVRIAPEGGACRCGAALAALL